MAQRRPGNMKFAQRFDGHLSLSVWEGVREKDMASFILGGGLLIVPARLVG